MEKVLWFEGAGCVPCNDVPNCRIRTAFVNDEGQWVYLEIESGYIDKERAKGMAGKAGFKAGDHYAYVDSAHYITDDPAIDDCNRCRLDVDVHCGWSRWYWNGRRNKGAFDGNIYESLQPYTMDGILRIVNDRCHASFDRIEVSDILTGYRVFSDYGEHGTRSAYNRGDTFHYDRRIHMAMLAKRDELTAYHKDLFDLKYDNTSYWNDSDGTYTAPRMSVCVNVGERKRGAVYPQRQFTVDVNG